MPPKGSTKTSRLFKNLKSRPEVKTPIATDMFLPNHSGISNHPEFNKAGDDRWVKKAGDTMTGGLLIDVGAAEVFPSIQVGDITNDKNYMSLWKPSIVGASVPDLAFYLYAPDKWPSMTMESSDDTFVMDYEGEASGVPGWVIETGLHTIRMKPGNGIFQVEGKFQMGQPFATEFGGNAGFVEWFHDGTDGFITSSTGAIFIPQLDTGGNSLRSLGDSTSELEVRRTVSDLDNTNVTGAATIHVGGNGSFATDLTYKIEITTGGEIGVAKYRWSDDGGSTWDEENITSGISPHNMNNGLKVWFVGSGGTDFNTNDFATVTAIGTNNQVTTLVVDTNTNTVHLGVRTGTLNDTLNVHGDVDIVHTSSNQDDHALEIDVNASGLGDVKAIDVVYTTGDMQLGDDGEALLVNLDQTGATGGDFNGVEVLSTEGNMTVHGLEVGAGVGPIDQISGVFVDMDSILVDGVSKINELKSGGAGDITLFVDNADTVIVGDAAQFEEIEFILDITASGGGIQPKFEFSTGGSGFTEFSPADGTNGFRNNGVMLWVLGDIPSWAANSGEFLIKITRQRVNLTTSPRCDKVQIVKGTEFSWNKDGDLSVNAINAIGALSVDNSAVFNESGADKDFRVEGASEPNLFFVDASTSRVGIGTATPETSLNIKQDGSLFPQIRLERTGSGPVIGVFETGSNTMKVGTRSNDQLVFKTNNTDKMTLAADGDFGIGTGSPAARLHVDQDSATGAQPVLYLDQADVSEEMIQMVSVAGTGSAIELVGGKSLTTTMFIKCTINGSTVYIPAGTIA